MAAFPRVDLGTAALPRVDPGTATLPPHGSSGGTLPATNDLGHAVAGSDGALSHDDWRRPSTARIWGQRPLPHLDLAAVALPLHRSSSGCHILRR